jgi:ABC-type antimicrobial peptide transport system ATPase subunit
MISSDFIEKIAQYLFNKYYYKCLNKFQELIDLLNKFGFKRKVDLDKAYNYMVNIVEAHNKKFIWVINWKSHKEIQIKLTPTKKLVILKNGKFKIKIINTLI